MNKLFLLPLVVSSCVLALGQYQSATPPFVMSITAEPVVKAGGDVAVTVHFKNTSNQELNHNANISNLTEVDPNYIFEVRDHSGALVPRKVYEHPELANGHVVFLTLKPGESVTDTEPISRLLDLRRPGKYVIQVSRRVNANDEKDGVVKSNKLIVTVVP